MGDESDIKSLDFWSRVDMAFPSHDSPSRGTCVPIVIRQRLEMIETLRRIQRFWLVGYWTSEDRFPVKPFRFARTEFVANEW